MKFGGTMPIYREEGDSGERANEFEQQDFGCLARGRCGSNDVERFGGDVEI